ncbi:MAG: radical SAM protein [Thermodesulfobacteriota bacterium]|nr:radical SAM protein [Thermodesulfobacteriota bacterium]
MDNQSFVPGYLELQESGELEKRIESAYALLSECVLCPRRCKIDRLNDKMGICKTGLKAVVSSYDPHFGEESPLVGRKGSGTIFITHCNLLCIFCQNYGISHQGDGIEATDEQLAAMMIKLQKQGCHNINFVTPTHVVPQILAALPHAVKNGLSIPIVYNSSGYDSVDTLRLLDGVVDIYMPDFKFWDPEKASRFAKAPDYPERAREAILEMHRQVGGLVLDQRQIAVHGLLVRHLVMPGGLKETKEIMGFLAREISSETYVNVMAQYRPCGLASQYPPINRSLLPEEFEEARRLAGEAGLTRLDEKDWAGLFRLLGIT